MIASLLNILSRPGKSRAASFAVSIGLLFALAAPLRAAEEAAGEQTLPGVELPPGFLEPGAADTLARDSADVKSPAGALLRGLALPGWGQFYTGHNIRGGLTAVLETAFFSGTYLKFRDCNRQKDRLHQLEREMGGDWPLTDPERLALNQRIKSLRQKGGDYLAYGLTTLLLGMIDSYVSAHLYRFDRNFRVMAGPGAVIIALHY